MNRFLLSLLASLLLLVGACTEPITVGSDLVDDDLAVIGQTTTLPFTTAVVREDSLQVYNASTNQAIGGFTFGATDDAVAGRWQHGLYAVAQPFRDNRGLATAPPFIANSGSDLDSVVLILPIDTSLAFFGPSRTYPLNMRLLTGLVDDQRDYFSDVSLPTAGEPINGAAAFTVSAEDRFLYDTIYAGGDTVVAPHVRIPFNETFVTAFGALDTTDFASDTTFWEAFPGVYLEPDPGTGGLVTLLPQANRSGQSPYAGFYFFYRDSATQNPRFLRRPLSLWLPAYQKDFSGSLAGDLLEAGPDDERVVIAGQAGTLLEISFPDLSSLENVIVNQAEITLYREAVDGYDYEIKPAPEFLALYYRNDDGVLTPIEDRQRLGNPSNSASVRRFLGGDPQTDAEGNVFYQPRFSVHLQRMLDGEVPSRIYARVVPTDRDPSRVVLTGPAGAVRPASIKITFTELD